MVGEIVPNPAPIQGLAARPITCSAPPSAQVWGCERQPLRGQRRNETVALLSLLASQQSWSHLGVCL